MPTFLFVCKIIIVVCGVLGFVGMMGDNGSRSNMEDYDA